MNQLNYIQQNSGNTSEGSERKNPTENKVSETRIVHFSIENRASETRTVHFSVDGSTSETRASLFSTDGSKPGIQERFQTSDHLFNSKKNYSITK
jgi:hypothetical protein